MNICISYGVDRWQIGIAGTRRREIMLPWNDGMGEDGQILVTQESKVKFGSDEWGTLA